jgi:hypothetical protein
LVTAGGEIVNERLRQLYGLAALDTELRPPWEAAARTVEENKA